MAAPVADGGGVGGGGGMGDGGGGGGPPGAQATVSDLGGGWVAAPDPRSGFYCYCNQSTGITTWTLPDPWMRIPDQLWADLTLQDIRK